MENKDIRKTMDLEMFEEYFSEDLKTLEEEIQKTDKLYDIINENIKKTSGSDARGAYHYLIEHCKNLISVQTQKQSILKDRMNLKKTILDYGIKNNSGGNSQEDMMAALNQLIADSKKDIKSNIIDDLDMDEEIERRLNEEE